MRLAIVTARGGSKRIPRKNIREFCGRPIISYSIEAAIDSGCFDEVMVSTDDQEIADIAVANGASVPFFRSAGTSGDHATTADVIAEVLHEYSSRGHNVDITCCLYPTAPFVTNATLRSGLELLESDHRFSGVVPVARFSYPIQRALRVRDRCVEMLQPEHLLTRSQDLESAYHDAGQFYWLRVASFLAEPRLLKATMAALVIPEWQVQDIDNEADWVAAEFKFSQLRQRLTEHATEKTR
ncbi:MAG: pseudaminic acid cytidylyltransferase [Vicinamibacterales bacterium]